MATVTDRLRLLITGDNADALAKMAEVESASTKTASKSAKEFDKATTKIGKGFSSLGSMASQFGLPFENTLDKIGKKFDEAKGASSKFSAISGVGAAVTGAALLGVAGESLHLADSFEAAKASMDAAIKASGTNVNAWQGQIDKATSHMASLGFTADDTAQAIATGTVATKSVSKSLQTLSLAADLARMKHESLAQATLVVTRAEEGNSRVLKQLGIDLPVVSGGALKLKTAHQSLANATYTVNQLLAKNHGVITTSSKDYYTYEAAVRKVRLAEKAVGDATNAHRQIQEALDNRLGGQSQAYAKTMAGRMAAVSAEMHNAGIQIGQKLMPFVAKLAAGFAAFIGYLTSHKAVLIALLGAVTAALLAMVGMWAYNTIAAMAFWTAATGGIVILVAALAVGIAWIVSHWSQIWKWVKGVVDDAWHHIVGAFHDVIDWLGRNWPLILAIMTGPFGLAILWITDHWNQVVNFFSGAVNTIGGVFSSIGNVIVGAFKDAFNGVADLWNNTIGAFSIHLPSWLGGGSFSMPQIPLMRAAGGPVSSGSPYIVGERGPELFVPSMGGHIVNASQTARMGGGHTINIYTQSNASASDIANEVGWILRTQAA